MLYRVAVSINPGTRNEKYYIGTPGTNVNLSGGRYVSDAQGLCECQIKTPPHRPPSEIKPSLSLSLDFWISLTY